MSDLNFAADTISSFSGLDNLGNIARKAAASDASQKQLEKMAKSFESVLLGKLLDEMKNSIPESGLFETPISKQVHDMFWFYLAQDIGEKGGMGLWKEIHHQMSDVLVGQPGGESLEQLL
jgi:Rod binding domain-containing protein